jgi:hypothetical protein
MLSIVFTRATGPNFPEDSILNSHSSENFKSELFSASENVLRYFIPNPCFSSLSIPQATTGLETISYRRALLSTLLHVSLIPTSHNKPRTYQSQKSATEHASTCKSHSHKPQQASTHQSQRSATVHTSTCKSHSHKPQQASTHQSQRSATDHSSTFMSHSINPQL